jgi:hypothetical protein
MSKTRFPNWLVLIAAAPGLVLPCLLALWAFGSATPSAQTAVKTEAHPDLLYGRITMDDGVVYEGRLRWGGDQEALWGNYFNGVKNANPWAALAPADRLPTRREPIAFFGLEIAGWTRPIDLTRPFMARFGDIARIDPRGRDLRVTLKSGSVFHLDRFGADDMNDGVRVWDGRRGVVDLGEWHIQTIEFLPNASPSAASPSLYGTVRTREGEFTGFLQWGREQCLGVDELHGHTAAGDLSVRFDTIRSIARGSLNSALVTLLDGREIALSSTREVGQNNRGIYVDDVRYGRVLVSWDVFERVDFSLGHTGPAYRDFPAGRALTGNVLTRSGRHLTGRLVYDLDESETTETLDAPSHGVDYTIPLALVASIVPPGAEGGQRARVTLQSGEELLLEQSGDLGRENAGLLIFSGGSERPEYVPWHDVERIELDRR